MRLFSFGREGTCSIRSATYIPITTKPCSTRTRTAVLNAMRDSGVQLIVNSGSSVPSSRRSVELARDFDFMRLGGGVPAGGLHRAGGAGWSRSKPWPGTRRWWAIPARSGLDYFSPDAGPEAKKRVFEPQLELAALGLPVVIHDRDADEDMLDMLRRHPVPGMIHPLFSARRSRLCLPGHGPEPGHRLGHHLSQRGAPGSGARCAYRLLLETDCPFLPTCSHEGSAPRRTCWPKWPRPLPGCGGDVSAAEVASIALANAKRLFHLDESL